MNTIHSRIEGACALRTCETKSKANRPNTTTTVIVHVKALTSTKTSGEKQQQPEVSPTTNGGQRDRGGCPRRVDDQRCRSGYSPPTTPNCSLLDLPVATRTRHLSGLRQRYAYFGHRYPAGRLLGWRLGASTGWFPARLHEPELRGVLSLRTGRRRRGTQASP